MFTPKKVNLPPQKKNFVMPIKKRPPIKTNSKNNSVRD